MWSGQYTILIVFPGRPHYLSPISCSNLKTFLPIFKHLESNSCILVNWPALYLFGLVDERDSSVRNERILSFFHFSVFQRLSVFLSVFWFRPRLRFRLRKSSTRTRRRSCTYNCTLSFILSLSLSTYLSSISLFLPILLQSSFSNSFGSRSTSRSRERRSSASFSRIDSSRFYSSFLWSR